MKQHIFTLICLVPLLCSCTKPKLFTDYFVAFDLSKSSPTRIDCEGRIESNYVVNLSSATPKKPIVVNYKIIPGDGLTEGVDYELGSQKKTLEFYPGIFEKSIKINWLPNTIDKTKDNTLTIRLESSNADLCLGFPGPDELNRTITITKYINN